MRILTLILTLCLAGLPRLTNAALQDAPLPAADVRAIRDLQARNLGQPSLGSNAPRGETLLALAELGGAARSSGGSWSKDDDNALFALLQNYRDELLAMGMDSAELEAQLEQLKSRTNEVERRLEALKPKDGLKINGRVAAMLDDLHVFGNGPLGAISALSGKQQKPAKAAYKGVRTQLGAVNGLFTLSGTRGLLSAEAKLDILAPWGTNNVAYAGWRRVYVEMRLPVAIQFGDVDASLTPLTLWRNDTVDPFEPEPFASREKRLRDDLLLVPDKWKVRGARLSTETRLFDAADLHLESLSSIAANFNHNNGNFSGTFNTLYQIPSAANEGLVARYMIYMQAWQARLQFQDRSLGYQGILFWDDTSSVYNTGSWSFRSMQSLVQSADLDWSIGPVRLQAEGAFSAFTPSGLTAVAAPLPLTGTAITGALSYKGEDGHVRVFGRTVGSGFHAAAAQGRTVDADWQLLGPLMTENSQLDENGKVGIGTIIVPSNASRLNDVLIPPGVKAVSASKPIGGLAGNWDHLRSYFPHEEIDPYGAATPNRNGFGAEAGWAFASKSLNPILSYESFTNGEAVADSAGNTYAPFSMTRMRAGLEVDLAPWLGWPLSFGGGYTATTSANGGKSAAGKDYSLTTTMMDASIAWGKGKVYGLAAGYRLLSDEGLHPILYTPTDPKQSWDMLGIGGWWRPMASTSVDMVYSSGHFDVPEKPLLGFQTEQIVLRLTTEF